MQEPMSFRMNWGFSHLFEILKLFEIGSREESNSR